LVFTAGVGEHSSAIRAECCAGLAWLGVAIDEPANAAVADDDADISVPDAVVRTLVIHAREELVIARECRDVLAGSLPFEA
jgi:acetate kinase